MLTIAKLGGGLVITTLTIFLIGLAVESIAPAQRRQPASGTRFNIGYAMFHAFVRSAVATVLAGVPVLGIGALGGGLIGLPRSGWGIALSVIVYVVFVDFGEYLFHRAQHAWPALWALHSLHHCDRAVNVTTTTRHHWIDVFIRSAVIYPVVGLLFAVPYQAVLANGLIGYYNYFLHLNIKASLGPLWAVLNSPQYHRLHHSDAARHQSKNFAALFPLFDVLFGTHCRPATGEYPTTGIEGQRGPTRIWEAVAWPFGTSSAGRANVAAASGVAPSQNCS